MHWGHCPALGAGQGKGQTGRKGSGAVFFNDPGGGGALAPLKFFQSDSQSQQFFKNQPVPRCFQRFCIGRKVDVAHGRVQIFQTVFFPQGGGQGVRQRCHVCQGVVYRPGDQVCIQAAGLGVNGVDPPCGERFNLGCAHLHGGEVALYLAQQQVVLVHTQLLCQEFGVEQGYMDQSLPIGKIRFVEGHALADQVGAHGGYHGGLHAHSCALRRLGGRGGHAPVLIGARIIAHQVPHDKYAQLMKKPGSFVANTFQVLNIAF